VQERSSGGSEPPGTLQDEAKLRAALACLAADKQIAAMLSPSAEAVEAGGPDAYKVHVEAATPDLLVRGQHQPGFVPAWKQDHAFVAFRFGNYVDFVSGVLAVRRVGSAVAVDGAFLLYEEFLD
jgi:hypothetical protein